ncbi:MAG: AAA family ATPase [Candidatus Paceibacteria bacterium]
MIVGITGTDGAGKGTVVDYLVNEKGFAHYHARTLIIEEIEKRGLEVNRSNMRIVANDLRREHGNDYIVSFFLERSKKTGDKKVVIDSLRAVAEAETLKKAGGTLVAVDADQEIRFERVQARRSESDKVSFEEFARHEALEMNDPDPHGMQKAKVIEMADYTILNNGTFEDVYMQVEAILKKLN